MTTRNRCVLLAFLTTWLLPASIQAAELTLADGGRSDYKIVVADDASPSTKHGAEELQKFLMEISGARLTIISDKTPQGAKEIVLGNCARLKQLGVKIDFAALGKEGYVIRTVGPHLVIAGGDQRGTMYGVYGLLGDHLGCRWFSQDVSRIPKQSKLSLGSIDQQVVPVLEYREPFMFECRDADWCARNRVNGTASRLDERRGGKEVRVGMGFAGVVPAEKYYEAHPEYFALVKGKRPWNKTGQNWEKNPQVCCTHPDVIRICTEEMLSTMRRNPNHTIFTLTPNDFDGHCECERCQALAKQEETQAAPLLELINRIAEAAEKEYPDKLVGTLAYSWHRRPPKSMRLRPNVLIMMAPIGCCFAHPLPACDAAANKEWTADVETWSKIAPRLWVWNYGTNFAHPLVPFPNLRSIAPNFRFYVKHNVKGIFEQCCENSPGIEFAELRGYLLAKCLWNPDCDPEAVINEFLEGYYGKAAEPIRQYIDLLHDKVERENIHLRVFSSQSYAPYQPYLAPDLLAKANMLWQRAERLAADQPDVLRRVKLSRMSVDYAIAERARAMVKKDKQVPLDAKFMRLARTRVEPFTSVLKTSTVKYVQSWPVSWPNLLTPKYCEDLPKELASDGAQ